jgi:hypothetical protein
VLCINQQWAPLRLPIFPLGNFQLDAQWRKTNPITEVPPNLLFIDAAGEIGHVCLIQNAREDSFPFSGNELRRDLKRRIVIGSNGQD